MSNLPYHKRYHGDALGGFMALTLEERGAYQTLLDLIYDHGGPIADDERLLSAYMRCSTRKWRVIRDELIAKRKIRINRDGLLTNGRAEKELENSAKTSRTLSESGAKGGRTRAENKKKANENSDSEQASLEPGLSEAQAILEARVREEEGSDTNVSGAKPPDLVKELFDRGVALLMAAGSTQVEARKMVGLWRKNLGDERTGELLEEAKGKTAPIAWIQAAAAKPASDLDVLIASVERKYPARTAA